MKYVLGIVMAFAACIGMANEASAVEKVTTTTTTTTFKLTETEQQILNRVNAERAKRGLGALVADEGLTIRARNHAGFLARGGWGHSRGAAENIARGQADAAAVMNTWMNSSGHRANILSGWTRIGVGALGRNYVQQFSVVPYPVAAPAAAAAEGLTKEGAAPVAKQAAPVTKKQTVVCGPNGCTVQTQACGPNGCATLTESYGLGKGRFKNLVAKLRDRRNN
jgi:hypothetical protein